MKINPKKCVACGNCTYVCPVGAIYVDLVTNRATINNEECVECYACFNGLSQEHLNPTLVRTMRGAFRALRLRFDPEPDVCPTAAFEPDPLMSDVATGTIREDILNEKVLSAIVEIKVAVERTEEIVRLVWDVEKQIQTVVALGVGARCEDDGTERIVAPILERLGYKIHRAKTNIGIGKITNQAIEVRQEALAR